MSMPILLAILVPLVLVALGVVVWLGVKHGAEAALNKPRKLPSLRPRAKSVKEPECNGVTPARPAVSYARQHWASGNSAVEGAPKPSDPGFNQ